MTSSRGFAGGDHREEHSMAPAPPLTQNYCPGKTPYEGTTACPDPSATPGRCEVILQKPWGFHIPAPPSHHQNPCRVFLKTQQDANSEQKAPGQPSLPICHTSEDIFPWPPPGRRDSNKLWKEAENNNPESCKHLEGQCLAPQFCIDFLLQIDF